MVKKKLNWVPTMGHAVIKTNEITYEPTDITSGPNQGQVQVCILKCDEAFESGTISFNVHISEPDSSASIILNHDSANQIFVGLGTGSQFGIQLWINSRWEPLSTVNPSGRPEPGKYKVKVKVLGSNISLFINDVKVCNSNYFTKKAQPAIFLSGKENITISDFTIDSRQSKAFVVMQFTDEFNELYEEVIRPTVEAFGIESMRADDFYTSGLILNDIAQSIIESQFIIADITPDNPNVFYEVGYAHGIGKPVILLSEKSREKLPFDVSAFRTLFYDNSIGGKSKVEERLKKFISSILSD